MIDIVFPDGNEQEFVDMAVKLGFSSLCFVYDKPKKLNVESDKLELFVGVVSDSIVSSDLSLVRSKDDNRFFFEHSQSDLIFDLEVGRKDRTHFRVSGLDQVVCRLAHDNYKLVAFSFASVLNSDGRKRSEIVGRMMQNARFCRKFKVKTVIASFAKNPMQMRSVHDLKAFGIVLGMHPLDAKLSLRNAYDKIKHNFKKRSPDYLGEGIEVVE